MEDLCPVRVDRYKLECENSQKRKLGSVRKLGRRAS